MNFEKSLVGPLVDSQLKLQENHPSVNPAVEYVQNHFVSICQELGIARGIENDLVARMDVPDIEPLLDFDSIDLDGVVLGDNQPENVSEGPTNQDFDGLDIDMSRF